MENAELPVSELWEEAAEPGENQLRRRGNTPTLYRQAWVTIKPKSQVTVTPPQKN